MAPSNESSAYSVERERKRKRARAIVFSLGVILYVVGVTSIWHYPRLANRTYRSENALMPAEALNNFEEKEFKEAIAVSRDFAKFVTNENTKSTAQRSSSASLWVFERLKSAGLETYLQHVHVPPSPFVPNEEDHYTDVVYSILRASTTSGCESLVLHVKYNSPEESKVEGEVSALGLGIALIKYFKTRNWLAKDIIFIATDYKDGEYGMKSWLHAYHKPMMDNTTEFVRAGSIQAAINIDFVPSKLTSLAVLLEGANGQLPNLDLVNAATRIVNRETLQNMLFLGNINPTVASLINALPSSLTQKHRPLLAFMINQALGVPTGDHAYFNTYHIDAITLTNRDPAVHGQAKPITMLALGRIIEGSLRSLNNLLERLHQSFYYYVLPSCYSYLSIAEYMISLGLVMIGVISQILLAFLTLDFSSEIIHSLCLSILFHIVGVLFLTLPFIIHSTATLLSSAPLNAHQIITAWLASIIVILCNVFLLLVPWVDRKFKKNPDWNSLHMFASLIFVAFVGSASLLNFSFGLFAGILFSPLYFLFTPSQKLLNLLLIAVYSPVSVIGISCYLLNTNLVDLLGQLIRQYQLFGNLLFPFLCLVLVPTTLSFVKLLSSSTKK